jgi:hypothetical protein
LASELSSVYNAGIANHTYLQCYIRRGPALFFLPFSADIFLCDRLDLRMVDLGSALLLLLLLRLLLAMSSISTVLVSARTTSW